MERFNLFLIRKNRKQLVKTSRFLLLELRQYFRRRNLLRIKFEMLCRGARYEYPERSPALDCNIPAIPPAGNKSRSTEWRGYRLRKTSRWCRPRKHPNSFHSNLGSQSSPAIYRGAGPDTYSRLHLSELDSLSRNSVSCCSSFYPTSVGTLAFMDSYMDASLSFIQKWTCHGNCIPQIFLNHPRSGYHTSSLFTITYYLPKIGLRF